RAKHKGSSLPSAIFPRVTSDILNYMLRQFAVELPRSPGSPEQRRLAGEYWGRDDLASAAVAKDDLQRESRVAGSPSEPFPFDRRDGVHFQNTRFYKERRARGRSEFSTTRHSAQRAEKQLKFAVERLSKLPSLFQLELISGAPVGELHRLKLC